MFVQVPEVLMRICQRTIAALVFLCIFAGVAIQSPAQSIEAEKATRKAKQTARALDLYTANLFHKRLSVFSDDAFVAVVYEGALAHPRQPAGAKLLETADYQLRWAVTEIDEHGSNLGRILFHIEVSLKKQPSTIATCRFNGKKLYLQVTGLPEKWTVDTQLPGADKGGSIRRLLARLGKRGR
jgi:hypothetical protein